MTITLSIWTNIKDEQKAASTFKDLLNGSGFVQVKSEIYWKDETQRVLTFQKVMENGKELKTKLFNDLNLISTSWTLNLDEPTNLHLGIDGHANENFKHPSISFATVINE